MTTQWTASMLLQDTFANRPTSDNLLEMLGDLYSEWVTQNLDLTRMQEWACERFETDMETMTDTTLNDGIAKRIVQFKKLYTLIQNDPTLPHDGDVQEKVARIAKVIREAANAVRAFMILYFQIDDTRNNGIPEAWNPESFFQFMTEQDEKASSFQKVVFHILRCLATEELRKLDDWCYKEVIIELEDGTSERTYAWYPFMDIRSYIYARIQKETNYVEWKNLTNPHDNGEKVVSHLMVGNHIEFPSLEMNRFLWAYANGLYNVKDDAFYPFRSCKIRNFKEVNRDLVRQTCHSVTDASDIDESGAKLTEDGVRVVVFDDVNGTLSPNTLFLIDYVVYSNKAGPEAWPMMAHRLETFRLGKHFACVDEVDVSFVCASNEFDFGDIQPPDPATGVSLCDNQLLAWNIGPNSALSTDTLFYHVANTSYHANRNGHTMWSRPDGSAYTVTPPKKDDVAVKFFERDFRFEISPETEVDFNPHDIHLPEMDKMMTDQELDEDSKMWVVAMLCRLFFPVGYDRWQVVLFIKGIAGSGKSTLAQIIRQFYPPSKVTTLSSNIEQKFGLSAIYKGLVCICAEVRESFGLDQGEWQSAVSGEEISVAIKNKTAIPVKWTTPMFFLGNELPDYRNNSGSVDRRVFMIEFRNKIIDSDPHLFNKFVDNIDLFQRKGVSLYHELLRVHGEKDVWAKGVVGSQIENWRNEVKKSTDQLYSFIKSGDFKTGTHEYMFLEDFKTLYSEFRRKNGFDKIRWQKEHYAAVFQEQSIVIYSDTKTYDGTEKSGLWLLGIDLRRSTGTTDASGMMN